MDLHKLIPAVACVAVALLAPQVQVATAQGGVGGQIGNKQIPDDSIRTLASGLTSAKDYRVTNNGPDHTLSVEVRDAEDVLINTQFIRNSGDSVDVGVPEGGSLSVRDPMDADMMKASVTYQVI